MKFTFLFCLLTLLVSFASAKSTSPAIEAFEFLVDPSMSREETANAASEVAEKYQLTLEEFLSIHEYGKGGNFDQFSSYQTLSDYSKVAPLRLDDLYRYAATTAPDTKGALFWYLTRNPSANSTTSPILFDGSDAELLDFIVKVAKTVSKKGTTEFLNHLFSMSGRQFYEEMKFSASDLTAILKASGDEKMSVYAAKTLLATLGIKTLVDIQPELLFSKIDFKDINKSSFQSEWEAVLVSYILAFTTDIDFLKGLKKSSKNIQFPVEIAQDVLSERFTQVSSRGEAGEAQVAKSMITIIDSAGYFETGYPFGMYWADEVIKKVYLKVSAD